MDELTPRQVELLDGLARGRSYAEIASAMRISVSAVKNHARDAYARLGRHNAAGAVGEAYARGILLVPQGVCCRSHLLGWLDARHQEVAGG